MVDMVKLDGKSASIGQEQIAASPITPTEIPVLIVGAGPVGLSAAIQLARLGVRSLVIERHPSTTDHPKARGFFTRTMEIIRPWGVEAALRADALPEGAFRFIWVETLVDCEIGRVEPSPRDSPNQRSPTWLCMAAQDAFEAVLCRHAETYANIELRFSTELTTFDQDKNGVTATLLDRRSGTTRTERAAWMIAADGAASPVREALGIAMRGPGGLAHNINIHFRAELAPWVGERPAIAYLYGGNRGVVLWLLWAHGTDRWLIWHPYQPEAGETAASFTPERCLELARQAIGIPDLPVELINTAFWTLTAQVAERFRDGRVLLAGDAAHRFPPTGGFGANTGIQDAHNLAWKLAGVLHGWAGEALLDTYTEERRPTAQANTDFSVTNGARWGAVVRAVMAGELSAIQEALREQVVHLDAEGLDLGFHYATGAVVPDGTAPPTPDTRRYVPNARPGSRAPHMWLRPSGAVAPVSTLDLFELGFTLLTDAADTACLRAGLAAAAELGVPLSAYAIGPGGDYLGEEGDWSELYGLDRGGAVLVRPDGHVAWRSRTMVGDAEGTMRRVLRTLLRR